MDWLTSNQLIINKDIKGLWIDTDCFWSVVIKLHITLSQVTRILNRKNNLIQTNFFFDTMIISILRVLLSGFLFGSIYSMLFGLAGAALSITVMYFVRRINKFTMVGVSIAGGVSHNIGQIIVAVFILGNVRISYYLPFLMISGIVAGVAIGIIGSILYRKIKILPQNKKK